MRNLIVIMMMWSATTINAQEIWQLTPWPPDSNYVLGALPSGEPTWVHKDSTGISGGVTDVFIEGDSLYTVIGADTTTVGYLYQGAVYMSTPSFFGTPKDGDLWHSTITNRLYIYQNGEWVLVSYRDIYTTTNTYHSEDSNSNTISVIWVNNTGTANVSNVLKGSKYVKIGYNFASGSSNLVHTNIFDVDTIPLFNTIGEIISDSLATYVFETDTSLINQLISDSLATIVFPPDSTIVTNGTGISVVESPANTFTVTNTAPDQTVSITGAGITNVTGTYPNFTVTSTEVDGSTTNEKINSISWNDSQDSLQVNENGIIYRTKITGFLTGTDTTLINQLISDSLATYVFETDTLLINQLISDSLATIVFPPDSTIVTNGTGISVVESPANTFTVTNTAPDQLVTIIGASGTYPNFTVANPPDSTVVQNSYGTIITESPFNTWNIKVDSTKFATPYDLTLIPNPPDSTVIVDGWGITSVEMPTNTYNLMADSSQVFTQYDGTLKQNTLISGTNIKTVNGNSLLGSGNVVISSVDSTGVSGGYGIDVTEVSNVFTVKADTSELSTPYDLTLKEDKLTFSNGLTRTSNEVKNDLITGKGTTQTVYGGVNSGNTLKLRGNTVDDNGKILLGDNAAYNEAGMLGIGTTIPVATLDLSTPAYNSIRMHDAGSGTNMKTWAITSGSGQGERMLNFASRNDAGSDYNFMSWQRVNNSHVMANLFIPHLAAASGTEVLTSDTGGEIYKSALNTVNGSSLFGSGNITTESPLSFSSPLSRSSNTISLPAANTSVSGHLTSTDWNTFNNKFTLPSLTSGSVLFSNGTTIAQDNGKFFYDNPNDRLGLGTNAPGAVLEINKLLDIGLKIVGSGGSIPLMELRGQGFFSSIDFFGGPSINSTNKFQFGQYDTGQAFFFNAGANPISFYTNFVERFTISGAGNVGVGQPSPSYKLDVNGIFRSTGNGIVNNAFIGDVGYGGTWAGFGNSSIASTTGFALMQNAAGTSVYINKKAGSGAIYFTSDFGTNLASIVDAGTFKINSLAGSGSRMVVASSSGDLSTSAIPTAPETFAAVGSKIQSWNSTGTFGSGKDVGFGVDPTREIDVNGDARLRGAIYDSANSAGSSGQVLTSQGAGAWIWATPTFSEVDGSITNEGYTGVRSGGSNDAILQGYNSSGTATGSGTTLNGGGGITITETTSTNGGTININTTAPLKQIYTTAGSFTWTKPAGARMIFVRVIGAGGGGAGGSKNNTSSFVPGGGGGGGGGTSEYYFEESEITSPVTITVGAGGAGGAGATSSPGVGVNGSAGQNSSFGSYLVAYGGIRGQFYDSSSDIAYGTVEDGAKGGYWDSGVGSRVIAQRTRITAGGGGNGGAINNGVVNNTNNNGAQLLLFTGGVWSHLIGTAGVAGGNSSTTGNANNGVTNLGLGGGGGGGGAALNGVGNGGNGGVGAKGGVLVITYF